MIEDAKVAVFLLLAGAIALVVSGRGSVVLSGLGQVYAATRSLFSVVSWRRKWRNPLLRLVALLLLLHLAGWGATISQVGLEATQKAIAFRHPPSSFAAACYQVQQLVVETLDGWPNLKPGPLNPMVGYDCPLSGTYSLDESGVLTCSKHGSAPDNPPFLAPPPKEPNP